MNRKIVDHKTKFHINGKPLKINNKEKSVLDFWKWAYSDLYQNVIRGMVGQFLVAWALDVTDMPDDVWGSFDLTAPNGKKVEVKTTSYLQTWNYAKPNPSFQIKKTRPYSPESGYGDKKSYQADIYVLCYFFETNYEKADIANLDQWKFWVLSRNEISKLFENKSKITVKQLEQDYQVLRIDELRNKIMNVYDT